MKRLSVILLLPIVMLALEPVNLIKDHSFEKDSEVWSIRTESTGEYDSTIISVRDSESAYVGDFSGSIDTRLKPAQDLPSEYLNEGFLYQILYPPKKLGDLDSLILSHMILFRVNGVKGSIWAYGVDLFFRRPSDNRQIIAYYGWTAPDVNTSDNETYKCFPETAGSEGEWYESKRGLKPDLIGVKGLTEDFELDSVSFFSTGISILGQWRGQKAFFDGIRLTGYADYDVGVKEILSAETAEQGDTYTPVARIKNFGREDADEFSVISEIWDGEELVHADTVPYTLPGDTEDTLSLPEYTFTAPGTYYLHVRTENDPDECDEDDECSIEISVTGVEETPEPEISTFDVVSLTSESIRVSYSTPTGQSGTISLYNSIGQKVESKRVSGYRTVEFGSVTGELTSGVHFVRLEAGEMTIIRKVIVVE